MGDPRRHSLHGNGGSARVSPPLPSPAQHANPDDPASSSAPASAPAAHPSDDQQQPIEAASEPGEADEFYLSEGFNDGDDDGARSTGSTSVTSSVYANNYEHGRRYQHFKNGRYPIPNDNEEQTREDMKHAMLLELMDGELFYAPIGDHPQQILDVGTGTGIWAIDAGDRFPSARVRGIDLAPIQPIWVPPNVDFLVDDCERDFLMRDCDLVHFRFMGIILKNTATVLDNAYQALRPGGFIEFQELSAEPLCDDGTMPDDDPVKHMYDICHRAFARFGADVTMAKDLEPRLRDAGFVNVQRIVKKVPIGVWARDPTLRLVGLYQKTAVLDFMPALAGRPFTGLGMSALESQVVLAHARRGLEDASVHRYFNYYFWYAERPE